LELEIELTPETTYTIEFLGTRAGYDASSKPVTDEQGKEIRATRIYSDDVGEVLARVEGPQASYKFHGDELYVRARVISSRKHPNPSQPDEFERAWVQPVVGPAAPKSR
jgi:hypothetical protein